MSLINSTLRSFSPFQGISELHSFPASLSAALNNPSTIIHSHPALSFPTPNFAEPPTPSNRRCRSRCARCSRTPSRCPRPCLGRRSVHAAGRRLRRARRGRPQGHRIGRQACSDLRGGSRGTNQYHSSEYGSHANVFTEKRVEHWR